MEKSEESAEWLPIGDFPGEMISDSKLNGAPPSPFRQQGPFWIAGDNGGNGLHRILLIDDKPYGLKQIMNAIPPSLEKDWQILYFSSFHEYERQHLGKVGVVLLDYFLDQDQCYGEEVIKQIDTRVLIGFSSHQAMSDRIIRRTTHYLESRRNQIDSFEFPRLFSVRKLKESDDNPALAKVFQEILFRVFH
ncbi:MAG: hypothetical protein HQM12_17905 [SAR324 cluster bacterium]|nr:hypothetical protein [SAR324 cluster bacterium]